VAKTYMLWNGTEEDGNVRRVKRKKAVLMERATLVGKGG